MKTHVAISFLVCQISQWEIKYISLLLFLRQMKIVLQWQFRYIDYIPKIIANHTWFGGHMDVNC